MADEDIYHTTHTSFFGCHKNDKSKLRELPAQRSALDAVLLIDASGSMNLTDPMRLRYQGAKLLLQFLVHLNN